MGPRGRGDDMNRIQPKASTKSMFLAESDKDISTALTPSAKTIILKSILLDWCKAYPGDQIIGEMETSCVASMTDC